MTAEIILGTSRVTHESMPYIIAEIGVNHEGKLTKALKLIDLAKEGGADAAKFQTYKAEKLASKHSPAYWDLKKESTSSQYALFKKYDSFNEVDYQKLANHCEDVNIDFISTAFDSDAVDYLEPMMPFYKIASADITNKPMLRQIASKNKPIVLSTGASNLGEIKEAISIIESNGCKEYALLQCVLNYPSSYENTNLNMIKGLMEEFPDQIIGYSDHTIPDKNMMVVTSAWIKGAQIIEKHFTDDKKQQGNDHYHAMDINDLKILRKNIEFLKQTDGGHKKIDLDSEDIARNNARRSIVALKDINSGSYISEELITCKRPNYGISPMHWDDIIGRKTIRKISEDKPLQWDDFE